MNIFITRLKCIIRNKPLLFWTLLFPIFMSTFFKLAFSNLSSLDNMETINVAFVTNETLDNNFYQIAKTLEISEGKLMFNITEANTEKANKLLEEGDIIGIVEMKAIDEIHLTLNNGGINQTILKSFLDEYLHTISTTQTIMQHAPGANPTEIAQGLMMSENYLRLKDNNTRSTDSILNYFYSLIGMTLIYGAFWGTDAVNVLQPNLSQHGIRQAIAPTKRFKLIFFHLLAAFIVHMIEVIIFILYMMLILKINFGEDLFLLLITCILGSITGILYGAFISLVFRKASEGLKIAFTSLSGVVGGFLSGMMVIEIKYYIQANVPFLQYINPVGVITDALYSLNYYTTYDRFLLNLGVLGIMIAIFLTVSVLIFRRDSYESI